MKLTKVDACKEPKVREQVRALYFTAFPKEERIPWLLLRSNAMRKGLGLTAYLDGDAFCGFTASVTVEGMHFLLFLAIPEALRGKGYGSAILESVKQEYGTVALNVEPLVPDAPNLLQRQERFAFYKKNGFFDTRYHVWEVGGMFRVLSTREQLDPVAYKKVFRKLTFGLWNVRLEKAE